MKLSCFVVGVITLLSAEAAPSKRAAKDRVDPHSMPSLALRSANPDRFWFSDHPKKPDNESAWAYSNDFGKTPGYWFRFNGRTQFPAHGERRYWNQTRVSGGEEYRGFGPKSRELPIEFVGYTGQSCDLSFVAQIYGPASEVCYGMWVPWNYVFSVEASDFTTQTNFYGDSGCNDYQWTERNWVGCSPPFWSSIQGLWSFG